MVFITKTSEDSITFVCLDGLDAASLTVEVPEMVIVGVLDETVVWTMLPLFDGKTNPSEDCVVTGVLLMEMIWETSLTVPAELMPLEGSDGATVGTNALDSDELLDVIEELLWVD